MTGGIIGTLAGAALAVGLVLGLHVTDSFAAILIGLGFGAIGSLIGIGAMRG